MKPKDKGRREEIAKLKHKKRCKALQIVPEQHYSFKSDGRPCSCSICKHERFSRKLKHKSKDLNINFIEVESVFGNYFDLI